MPAMIEEERALTQTARKRQRKRNQERNKGNGTDIGCYFYIISVYALVSSFLSYILPLNSKNQEAGRGDSLTAERMRQKKLSRHRLLLLQLFLLYLTLRIS